MLYIYIHVIYIHVIYIYIHVIYTYALYHVVDHGSQPHGSYCDWLPVNLGAWEILSLHGAVVPPQ